MLPLFSKRILRELAARHALLSRRDSTPVIDGDCHITNLRSLEPAVAARLRKTSGYYHGRPISALQLVAELDMAGVDMALVWQNPAVTPRGANRARNAAALRAANGYVLDSARRFPDRLLPAGWVDPAGLGLAGALSLVDDLIRQCGFLVVKMNPAQNRFPIDSPELSSVVDRIVSFGAIPAFHFGGDTEFTPASGLRRLARAFSPHRIIAVHMGGGGSHYAHGEALYQQTRALGLEQPNLFFIQSAKRDCHIESDIIAYQLAGASYCQNIGIGSDAPYGRVSWNFGRYRAMLASLRDRRHPDPRVRSAGRLFSRHAEQGYLDGNFSRLLAAGYARWSNRKSVV